MRRPRAKASRQAGYTLVELIIALALSSLLMVALTSVVLTTWRASTTATSRLQASGQVRNFDYFAFDDFARSGLPPYPAACGGVSSNPCDQPIQLTGTLMSNAVPPAATANFSVTYTWDQANLLLVRQAAGGSTNAATNVTAFAWHIDSSTPSPTVFVNLTITVDAYRESQTFRFYPRLNP